MLQGKLCVITGALKEPGERVAGMFAARKCNIAFMDMDKESGKRLKKVLMEQYGIEVFFFHGDIRSEEDRDLFAGYVTEQYGGADYFVYNTEMVSKIFDWKKEACFLIAT